MGWPISTLVACVLAFWMGFSANRGGACLVAAAYEVQLRRRPRMLIGLLVASAGAGLVAVPLDWSGIAGGRLAESTDITATIVVGAGSFGIGALINDACLLGSLNRLGGGEIRLVAMPFGLVAGLLLIDQSMVTRGTSWPSVLTEPNRLGGAALIAFLIIAVLSLTYISRRANSRFTRDRPLGVWMLALGTTGGALYAIAPDWHYVDLARRGLSLTMATPDESVILTFAASIAGAVTAALRQGSWRLQRPTLTDIARSLIGGAFMGVGVALIPGGNSGLVLAAIPALSPGGVVAYLMMMVAIFLGLSIRAWISHIETVA